MYIYTCKYVTGIKENEFLPQYYYYYKENEWRDLFDYEL